MSLRNVLIRLASSDTEIRPHLLPIITACGLEGPMQGKFEEGKPADPTENMTEEQKKEWELNTLKHKDKFKAASAAAELNLRAAVIRLAVEHPRFRGPVLAALRSAGCEKLPEGGMRDNCEKKQEEGGGEEKKEAAQGKAAGMVIVRRMVSIAVRVMQRKTLGTGWYLTGQMSLDFGGNTQPDAVRFTAIVDGSYNVLEFKPVKSVSGGGAEILVGILQDALQEALRLKGEQVLPEAPVNVPV